MIGARAWLAVQPSLRLGAEGDSWLQIFPTGLEDASKSYKSQYLLGLAGWKIEPADAWVSGGLGFGWHRSVYYGDAGRGLALALGVDGRMKHWEEASLGWSIQYKRSLSGSHPPFRVGGSLPGQYRPEFLALALRLSFGRR